ncbi:Rha family transcriptional regulator [Selenomonas noxia]|uniref:Rha family transcriptional regulator n=1 Tax=Selenomonas noxia TaxID=135083 RepID=UPI0028801FB4|nr:Rha family transcriptional regulator [Selenomonas noxia]
MSNNQVVVSSRDIAEHFGKRHDHVIRDIAAMQKDLPNFGEMYLEDIAPDSYGRDQKVYIMNRDGFSLLTMGFTGKKALEWKLKYIEAFNKMEAHIREGKALPKSKDIDRIQQKRADAMERNSRVRMANLFIKLADRTKIADYREVCNAKAAEVLAGYEILPLPTAERRTYSATEIGAMFGVSANKIGKVANKHQLKTPEYGKLFYSKSEHSVKEVETWRYYDSVIPVFEKIFGREAA